MAVELRHAFVFTCEECGEENFGEFVTRVLESGQEQTLTPNQVQCVECETVHDVDLSPLGDWLMLDPEPENN